MAFFNFNMTTQLTQATKDYILELPQVMNLRWHFASSDLGVGPKPSRMLGMGGEWTRQRKRTAVFEKMALLGKATSKAQQILYIEIRMDRIGKVIRQCDSTRLACWGLHTIPYGPARCHRLRVKFLHKLKIVSRGAQIILNSESLEGYSLPESRTHCELLDRCSSHLEAVKP